MNRWLLLLAMVLIVLAGCIVYGIQLYEYRIPAYRHGATPAIVPVTAFWKAQIEHFGGPEAYRRFGVAVRDLTDGEQHEYAHLFGEALWEAEGAPGFSVCDARYQTGCIHQFLGAAIHELGISSLKQFAEQCTVIDAKGAKGCAHGVGHVILSSTGYTLEALTRALATCKQYFTDGLGGCVDGAIMEYNIRDVASGGLEKAENARLFTTDNATTLCPSIPKEYRLTCAHEIPHWWFTVLPISTETYEKMGSWCRTYGGAMTDSCYGGIGYVVGGMHDINLITRICSVADNTQDSLPCLESAAQRYRIDDPSDPLLCDQFKLNAGELTPCRQFASQNLF